MDYELAKELKDAGFSQEPFWQVDVNAWGGSWYLLVKPEACAVPVFADPDAYRKGTEHGDTLVKMPTLSELIKACGHYMMTHGEGMEAYRLKLEGGQVEKSVGWSASIAGSSYGEWGLTHHGDTPEEVVARLWLTLNKES